MPKSLLALCYPTYSNALHLDSKGVAVVLAPDEILKSLHGLGVDVKAVNMSPFVTDKPLMRSGMQLINYSKSVVSDLIKNSEVCWHMFRDPTQPEVSALRDIIDDGTKERGNIINPLSTLDRMYKNEYLPILLKHGIGPKIVENKPQYVWTPSNHGCSINAERTVVMLPNYNNNRGDYPERERSRGYITVEFLDSAVNGIRSFFRVGFAMGKVIPGWIYSSSAEQFVQKTGTCKIKEPHSIPEKFHDSISKAMAEIGIDVCHIEGVYVNGEVKLFDINPYPTSYGNTLQPISDAMAYRIAEHYKWIE